MKLKEILESLDYGKMRKEAFMNNKTLHTYQEYYSILSKEDQKKLKAKMIEAGYTFSEGGIYSKETGKPLYGSDKIEIDLSDDKTDKTKDIKESEDKITLGMIKDIELIDGDDKNYFISYSPKYSETPEHDELPKKLIRKLLKDNNVDANEFWDNFVPYLDKNEAQKIVTDIFGDDASLSVINV